MDNFPSYQNGNHGKQQDFQKLALTVETSIQKISQNVSSMQRMVKQVGTHQDSPELRKQLHSLQHYTQKLVKDTNGYIKELNNFSVSSPSEQRQIKMQRERLHDEFAATLNRFQMAQRSTAQKEKEQVNKVREQNFSEPYLESNRKQPLIELQDSNYSKQQMQMQETADLRALEEQEQSIRELENDIRDVNDIFKELGVLVHEQGEIIDSIEANVEKTESFVHQGATQLREASNYKNKIRRKKVILAVIAAIFLTVIILIIYYGSKN
ncbi:syntaxin-7 [Coccinella septempunctata]|uniref:syntaxin-7 n=1 Tax=Coccinella septempunctata TaxID=41139 RepID=UPI001D092224|nr:syntaxin-7 [Coccinella septempunctata]